MTFKKYTLLALVICSISGTYAKDEFYGKGYTIVDKASVNRNDLSLTIYKKINATTVEQALREILNETGFGLAGYEAVEPEINRLYRQPYPSHKRLLGPMNLDEALTYVAGDAWRLVVDPVNKLISFELSSKYRCFPSTKKVCQ